MKKVKSEEMTLVDGSFYVVDLKDIKSFSFQDLDEEVYREKRRFSPNFMKGLSYRNFMITGPLANCKLLLVYRALDATLEELYTGKRFNITDIEPGSVKLFNGPEEWINTWHKVISRPLAIRVSDIKELDDEAKYDLAISNYSNEKKIQDALCTLDSKSRKALQNDIAAMVNFDFNAAYAENLILTKTKKQD